MTGCRHCTLEIIQREGDSLTPSMWVHQETGDASCDRKTHKLKRAEPSNGPMIDYIVDATRRIHAQQQRLADAIEERDAMIRDELHRGDASERRGKVARLAKLTGLSVPRLYQIRDRRR